MGSDGPGAQPERRPEDSRLWREDCDIIDSSGRLSRSILMILLPIHSHSSFLSFSPLDDHRLGFPISLACLSDEERLCEWFVLRVGMWCLTFLLGLYFNGLTFDVCFAWVLHCSFPSFLITAHSSARLGLWCVWLYIWV